MSPRNYVLPDHGTDARYNKGCKCTPCKVDHARAVRVAARRRRAEALGLLEPVRVDASEAAEHLKFLSENGVGKQAISIKSGIGADCLYNIRNGDRKTISKDIADRILSVSLEDSIFVSIQVFRKEVDCIVALGYTKKWIGQTCKFNVNVLSNHLNSKDKPVTKVRKETYNKVVSLRKALYEKHRVSKGL